MRPMSSYILFTFVSDGQHCLKFDKISGFDIRKPLILYLHASHIPVWKQTLIRRSQIPSLLPRMHGYLRSRKTTFSLPEQMANKTLVFFLCKKMMKLYIVAREISSQVGTLHKSVARSSFLFHVVMTSKPNPQVSALFSSPHVCLSCHLPTQIHASSSIFLPLGCGFSFCRHSSHPHIMNPFFFVLQQCIIFLRLKYTFGIYSQT